MYVLKKLLAAIQHLLETLYYLTFAVIGILSIPWLLSGSVRGRYSANGNFTPTNALGGSATFAAWNGSTCCGTTSGVVSTSSNAATAVGSHLQGGALWLVALVAALLILVLAFAAYQSIVSSVNSREAGLRRMIEFYGWKRYLQKLNAKIVSADEYGTLYHRRFIAGESLAILAVKNSTAEPDGSFKTYYLRVPPRTRTAREAVAWTFAVESADYRPTIET